MKRLPVRIPDHVIPRDYQIDGRDGGLYLAQSDPTNWHLFKAPTGSGKSLIELMVMEAVESAILVTNRLEIIAGMMDKLGYYVDDIGTNSLVELAAKHGIFTPIRLRNWLAKGKLEWYPELCIVDECHHDTASSYQDITMYLNGVPKIGFTASDFRGTPKGTAEFKSQWNNKTHEIITLETCINKGYVQLPIPIIWPLVDDDNIEVVNGEMKVTAADAYISDRVKSVIDRIKPMYCRKGKVYDMPTMIAVPSTNLVNQVTRELNQAGLPAISVTQATKRSDRTSAFQKCVAGTSILVQIDVVSEGVDLPIKRLIDLRPTMSPVKWVQQLGRIMRPGGQVPEYICCCRNLERHCYLMKGLIPNSTIVEAQQAYGLPSKRNTVRAIGLEELGRFKPNNVDTISGITVQTYNITAVDDYQKREYFILVHPGWEDTVKAERTIPRSTDGTYDYKNTRWKLIDQLPNLKGYASALAYPLTEKQTARWRKSSEDRGLNPHQKMDAKKIQILFFLLNTGLKLT